MTRSAQERWEDLRHKQSPVERATAVLRWTQMASQIRMSRIRARHPDASEAEMLALWTEETYRGTVDADFLARACAAIRNRDTAGA